jgi:CelD/BcsL family acetyltransferase involved in cellulose biosynthesis
VSSAAERPLAVASFSHAQARLERLSMSIAADDAELHFKVVDDIAALEADWNTLATRAAYPRQGFQSFAWMRAWAAHYADDGHDLRIVLGYRAGELALIWPLGLRRRFGIAVLQFLGEPLNQYHDVLIDDDAPAQALMTAALRYVRSLPHDVLILRRVREDSISAPALLAAGARVDRRERAPFIDFGEAKSFETFEASLSPKTRSNRRRRMRKIEQLGEITFESQLLPGRADELIATAMAFKREWALSGGRYAPAVFDPRFERCLREAARNPDPRAALRVFAMLCDGRPIGVEIAFGYKRRLFGHVLAPDPALSKFGLGNVLADAAIEDAFAQGYQVYDLLAPATPHKAVWTRHSVEVSDFSLAANARGVLAQAFGSKAADFGRSLAESAPRAVVRALLRRVARRGEKAGTASEGRLRPLREVLDRTRAGR